LTLTLLGRAYCHLCDEMREATSAMLARAGVALVELDVDADPALEARWGDKVPVLLDGDTALCFHRLDRAALARWLRQTLPTVASKSKIG
jgi:Glutaredoxin-like domain (DUF836)